MKEAYESLVASSPVLETGLVESNGFPAGALKAFSSSNKVRLSRRKMMARMASFAGLSLIPGAGSAFSAQNPSGGPKRVIFFLQNHGFDPLTCIPKGLVESCSLDGVTLEKPMQALEPYKNRMHIVNGL
ncbi:MAG: hypothetical protein WCN98_15050, partial [Verrucomicrobiaceae bacterium]